MLTHVQKETLQTLINLYHSSNGKPIKGEAIAEVINKNAGTIRNQMIALRNLGVVKSVPGPQGGYEPTLEAYHSLKISISENDDKVPIYKNGKKMDNISVARIEFTSVPQPSECEASIKVLGNIKNLNLGDEIIIGPTPVNNLGIAGTIVGRDDMDNILLVDAKTIRSIPKKTVGDIASYDVISFSTDCPLKEAAEKLSENNIKGAPVIEDGKVVGTFTLTDLVTAIANDNEYSTVGELMSTNFVIVDENIKIVEAIEIILKKSISLLIISNNNQSYYGIITRTDLLDSITNLKQFPIL